MMKLSILLVLVSLLFTTITGDDDDVDGCDLNPTEECVPTEYTKYVKCMRERTKRDINCRNQQQSDYEDLCNCDNYNCESCYTCKDTCETSCCSQCCNTISTCTTNHCCHNYCHTTCRDNNCRHSCKKTCREKIINNNNNNESTNHTNTIIREVNTKHNITTIINLNNIINNTNLINVPIIVNSTNFNNITLGQQNQLIAIKNNNNNNNQTTTTNNNTTCCLVIGPKQCIPQSKFPFIRCFHIRKRQCSSICLSPILHYHQYEFCDNNNNNNQSCQRQLIYIPQPKPRCAYQPYWPYVNCNGNNRYESCEGCYNHYINPYESNQCSPYCYDDGFGIGPYYRQGPFYRPGYAHTPSCYQTGFCNMIGNNYYYDNNIPLPFYQQPNYGGFYPNFDGNFPPLWNLGYPPHSYDDAPFIIDNIDNNNVNHSNNRQESIVDFFTTNPDRSINVELLNSPPKDVSIEAEIISPRSTRYAEIKIQAADQNNENNVELSTISGLQIKEEQDDDDGIEEEQEDGDGKKE